MAFTFERIARLCLLRGAKSKADTEGSIVCKRCSSGDVEECESTVFALEALDFGEVSVNAYP